MRKLSCLILLMGMCLLGMSQVAPVTPAAADSARNAAFRQLGGVPAKPLAGAVVQVSVANEISYMRHCIGRYNKQWGTGFCLQLVGGAVSVISAGRLASTNPEIATGFFVMGAGLFVVGTGVQLHARSHLNKFSVGLGGPGVQVQYTF